ncbi:MAG TPA: hypothetical protein VFW29_06020 [Solirubrobacteraceae bacterium]|nr:hypothetical protein [Solirubrobacteraceae bacterium]
MATSAVFPGVQPRAGFYESFYLRAFDPAGPLGAWIRYTVHKRPGASARGSLWFTLFDARLDAPVQQKHTSDALAVPPGGWIAIEDSRLGATEAAGECGGARWSLRVTPSAPELRHLRPELLYRAPVPRTKLTSPAPLARLDGSITTPAGGEIDVREWVGMVGHNWGGEHAERWIWMHGAGFEDAPDAWLDASLGRIAIGGRTTPFIANGTLCLDGVRHRLGGLGARGLEVAEGVDGARLRIPGARGLTLGIAIESPVALRAGWRYADPDGGEHDVVNCSLAALTLDVALPGGGTGRTLRTAHGGAYELGMRERDHGVAIAPFPDG